MINRHALEKVIHGTIEERMYLCERDFSLFFIYYFLDYIKYQFAPFHMDAMDKLQELVEDEAKKEMLFIGFRECAKSALARGFITWLVLFKKTDYILIGSYTQENAESNLFAIINAVQTNPRILNDFGSIAPTKKDEAKGFNRIKKFLTSSGVLLEAITTQKSPRGKLHKESRPGFCLLDDIETLKTSLSEAISESTRNFIKELLPAMDSKHGRVLYLANHFSDLGVVQDLVNQSPRMHYLNIPLYMGQQIMWPAKYCWTDAEAKNSDKVSIEEIKRRANDSITFEQEYLNMPMSEERRIFKRSLFKYKTWDEIKHKKLTCYVILDPAFTATTESDETGISVVWVDSEGFWYVKSYGVKLGPKELVEHIFGLYANYKPIHVGIEQVSFLNGLKPYLDTEMRRRNVFLPIVELKHTGKSKEIRIQGLLAYYESATIFHIEGECEQLEAQLIRFPLSEFDDVMDSLAYAPQMIKKPSSIEDYARILPDDRPLYDDIGM